MEEEEESQGQGQDGDRGRPRESTGQAAEGSGDENDEKIDDYEGDEGQEDEGAAETEGSMSMARDDLDGPARSDFSPEATMTLITAVRPFIEKREKKDWNVIQDELSQAGFSFTLTKIQQRWYNISKEFRAAAEAKGAAGGGGGANVEEAEVAGSGRKRKKTFKYYDLMYPWCLEIPKKPKSKKGRRPKEEADAGGQDGEMGKATGKKRKRATEDAAAGSTEAGGGASTSANEGGGKPANGGTGEEVEDVEGLRREVGGLKAEVRVLRTEVSTLRTEVTDLKRWVKQRLNAVLEQIEGAQKPPASSSTSSS